MAKKPYDVAERFQEVARLAEEKKKKKGINTAPSKPALEKMTRTAKGGKDVNLPYPDKKK